MEQAYSFEVGDLGFYRGDSLVSEWIIEVETHMDPNLDEYPSHVFMVLTKDPLTVVESIFTRNHNSIAAVTPGQPYQVALQKAAVVIARPPGDSAIKLRALQMLINTYSTKPYGWWALLGFLVQDWFNLPHNPLGDVDDVCSQTAWNYLFALANMYSTAKDYASAQDVQSVCNRITEGDSTPARLLAACAMPLTTIPRVIVHCTRKSDVASPNLRYRLRIGK